MIWTLAIVWTTQVLARIDLVTDSGQSALTFFEVAALILPSIIPIVVPFALVVAVAQTLSVMNSDSELAVDQRRRRLALDDRAADHAAGAGGQRLFLRRRQRRRPYARQKNRELVASSRADLLSLIIQEGTFRKIEDGLFLQIGERLPDNRLGGIFVADSREEGVNLVYYAKTGSVVERGDEKVLMMNDGVIHRKTLTGDLSVIRFTSYAFDLSAFMSAAGTPAVAEGPDDPVPAQSRPQRQDVPASGRNVPGRAQPALFRMAISLVFALIALAVAGDARSHREARINPLITAIAIALFVRWLGFFAARQGRQDAAICLYGLWRADRGLGCRHLVHRLQPDHGTAGRLAERLDDEFRRRISDGWTLHAPVGAPARSGRGVG